MRLLHRIKRSWWTWLGLLVGLPVLLTGCTGGVSEGELASVRGDLQQAQTQVQQLESEVSTLKETLAGLPQTGESVLQEGACDDVPSHAELKAALSQARNDNNGGVQSGYVGHSG